MLSHHKIHNSYSCVLHNFHKLYEFQFNYKGRGQSFAVRKVQTNPENQPSNAPKATSTVKKTNATKPQQGTTTKTRKLPAAEQRQKTNQKDFVKKNAQSAASGKGKKETKAVSGGAGGTVTLTQDQLNAILATIGQAAGNSAIPNISLGKWPLSYMYLKSLHHIDC